MATWKLQILQSPLKICLYTANLYVQKKMLRMVGVVVMLLVSVPAVLPDDAINVHKKTDVHMVKVDPDKGKYEIYTSMQVSIDNYIVSLMMFWGQFYKNVGH